MSYKSLIVVALLCICLVEAREKQRHVNYYPKGKTPVPVPDYNQTQLWFDAVVDH